MSEAALKPSSPSTSTHQISTAFPSRQVSSCSTNSGSESPHHLSVRSLNASLEPVARYALADLLTTLLRLDFWDDEDPNSIFFCKVAFDVVIRHVDLPERTARTLKTHLEGENLTDDIATLIISLREDACVREHSAVVLLSSLVFAFVETGNYDSRYRVLLRHLAALLGVSWEEFEEVEDSLASTLLDDHFVESDKCIVRADGHSKAARVKTARNKKIKRFLMIGAAGGVGGVLIGLTGGLAAPLVAAGATALGVTVAGGIATTAGAAILGSLFGVAGAGLAGYKMKKRVGAIEEFAVESLSEGVGLHCVLVVSGWIDKQEDAETAFEQQWRHCIHAREQYSLRYEGKYLAELGRAIDYLMSFAVSYAIQQTIMETALAGIMTAIAWPVALLSAASVLDNPWNVCVARAAEVGEHLAEVLLSRSHGKRPITLIGFSMGARVIYHCLLTMSKRAESVGIIEDVVLLGAPVSASPKQWAQICRVVGGRVINGYCDSDWLLRFVYRTMSVQFTIAGTGPVDNKQNRKISNFNLSHIVKGHMDYSRKLTEVLDAVGVKVSPHSEDSLNNLARLCEAEEVDEATQFEGEEMGELCDDVEEMRVKDRGPKKTLSSPTL